MEGLPSVGDIVSEHCLFNNLILTESAQSSRPIQSWSHHVRQTISSQASHCFPPSLPRKLGNSETCKLGNLETWKLGNLETQKPETRKLETGNTRSIKEVQFISMNRKGDDAMPKILATKPLSLLAKSFSCLGLSQDSQGPGGIGGLRRLG